MVLAVLKATILLEHWHIYADDIVLVALTPGSMRKLLSECDDFASEFDIVFNVSTSKFLVIVPYKRHYLCDILFKALRL